MADDGRGHHLRLSVREIGDETVVLGANHPLAGKNLVFDVTILRVESATPEEIAHGHAH
jgi:FKBP-type peptidyl-prolyl cis-trans isomerase SlyD